jgi:hypothetical protein
MRIEMNGEERAVLLRELDDFMTLMEKLYRDRGEEWDRYDSANGAHFEFLARTRDDLARDAPWVLDGPRASLEALLTGPDCEALRERVAHLLDASPPKKPRGVGKSPRR